MLQLNEKNPNPYDSQIRFCLSNKYYAKIIVYLCIIKVKARFYGIGPGLDKFLRGVLLSHEFMESRRCCIFASEGLLPAVQNRDPVSPSGRYCCFT